MVEQVEILPATEPVSGRPALLIACTVSVLLHLCILVLWQYPVVQKPVDVDHTLNVILLPQLVVPDTPTIRDEISNKDVTAIPASSGIESEPEPDQVAIDDVSKPRPAIPLKTSVTSIVKARVQAQAKLSHTCDPAQRASKIFICDDEEQDVWRNINHYSKYVYDNATSQYQQDLTSVRRLMRRHESLDRMINSLDHEPEDLVAERRELRRMIDGIEDKYARVDLLRLIGEGSKKAAKLWRSVSAEK